MADTPQPVESDEDDAKRWIGEIDASEKWQTDWVARARRIVRRYKSEWRNETGATDRTRRFAILWSNVQTLGPAIYARTPEPVVSRRFRDADPVGRYASEVLERALKFSIDQYDFDDRIKLSRDDYLLVARGQVWVRYVPHLSDQITNDVDTPPEYAEVECDHVNFADWGMQPCRSWDETDFVWRRCYLNRKQLKERFKKVGARIPLDWKPEDNSLSDASIKETQKRAAIYELWHKPSRTVFWISKSYPQILDQKPDFLNLRDFFPCPRPIMGTVPPGDSYIPIPDYVYYQDQAEELDELTARIGVLTDALRMIGIYAGENGEIFANMFNGDQNKVIPVPNMAELQEKGGLAKLIEWLPIDMVIDTLKGCFETRKQILEDIYQITGVSDIIRGASDPNETATAQGIKAQWGSLRVRDRQKELARFARDILRIKAEIIAEKFPVDVLKAMTDVQLLTNQEKQQFQSVQQLAQQNQQLAQQIGPQLQEKAQLMSLPSWEDVAGLLKNDALRSFRIDVETDSTIEPDENEEKQRRVEFVEAMSTLIGQSAPVVQMMPPLAPLVGEALKFLSRGFRVGREMEDVIERTVAQLGQMQPPQQPQQQPKGPTPEELQLKAQDQQQNAQLGVGKLQLEHAKLQQDGQLQAADLQLRARQQQIDAIQAARDPHPQSVS